MTEPHPPDAGTVYFFGQKSNNKMEKKMITDYIKTALRKKNIQYTMDEDSFNFKHPLCPTFVDCLITWEEMRNQIQIVADYEIKMPPSLSDEEFAAMLNDLNYDSSWGNLETDRHGLLVYRLATFLPDGRDAAIAICSKALEYFRKAPILQFRKVEIRLNQIHENGQSRNMCRAMPESLRSGVIELECMHHRLMQLADTADILFEEFQLVCQDAMTQTRLGDAGKERVKRDARVLRQEEEKLHAEIRAFATRYRLPLNLKELPSGWTLHGFHDDFALTGFLNTAVTDLFIALCGGNHHDA